MRSRELRTNGKVYCVRAGSMEARTPLIHLDGHDRGIVLIAQEVGAMTRAGNAAVLSLVLPGMGQFYNGDFLRGIFWLIVTPGLWIGSGGLLGWICHVIASVTAYRRAENHVT